MMNTSSDAYGGGSKGRNFIRATTAIFLASPRSALLIRVIPSASRKIAVPRGRSPTILQTVRNDHRDWHGYAVTPQNTIFPIAVEGSSGTRAGLRQNQK